MSGATDTPAPRAWLVPLAVTARPQEGVGVEVTVVASFSTDECLTLARELMAALMEFYRRRDEDRTRRLEGPEAER